MVEYFNAEKFHKDIKINRTDLDNEICTSPARLAYYIEQAARWNDKTRAAKILRDNRASELYIGLKTGRIEAETKVTDGYIEAVQKLDETYQQHDQEYANFSTQTALFEGAVTALIRKIDNLRSLNKNSNAEFSVTNTYVPVSAEEKADRKARVVEAQR